MRTTHLILMATIFVVALSGCAAKHGYYLETDKEFKGNIAIGWGPTSVIDAEMMGGFWLCIPSKTAMKSDDDAQWCAEMRAAMHETDKVVIE